MTVSEERREAVDFTEPFMTFGAAILMKKPRAGNKPNISSIKDLARQDVIKYGVIETGRTADFFRKSDDPAYMLMWQEMSGNPDYGMLPVSEEGIRRVRQSDGRYAFITEGTTADYWILRQPCDLVKVDGKIDTRHYALAVRHNYQLKAKLNEALTQMENDGVLNQLKRKWWDERSECSAATHVITSWSLLIALITALTAVASP